MAEQSSTVAAFRGLVMLICLILIPVAAFCGGSFPAVLKAVQAGRWPTLADFRGPPASAPTEATEAPRFSSVQSIPARTNNVNQPGIASGSAFPGQGEETRSQVIAAHYNAPSAAFPSTGGPGLSTDFPQNKETGGAPSRTIPPFPGGGFPVATDRPAAELPSNVSGPTSGPLSGSSPADQFKYVQERLRQLGATYYLLETCGDQKEEFRFFCRMAVGGNPRVNIPFWCIDADPLKAMTQVLKQVEAWQRGGG